MSRVLAPGVTISGSALTQLVAAAAESVEGVRVRRPRRGLDLGEDGRLELGLGVRYGLVLPECARAVQERVANALVTMCDLTPAGIDVTVEELD